MQTRPGVDILDDQLLDIAYYLVSHPYLGKQKSRQLFFAPQLKQNTDLWLQLVR